MNGWLLDTNVIAELARADGDIQVSRWAQERDESQIFISVLTLGEYIKGANNMPPEAPYRAQIEQSIDALESRFRGRILSVSDRIVRRWGRISGEIQRRTGRAHSVIDTLLAATAIEHELCLVTRNTKDVADTGAILFNPWADG